MNKRQQLGIESRQKILDAAERLLAKRGYSGMSINQLSKDSGLPVASLYWHFGSKAGVVAAVLDRRADLVFDAILRDVEVPDDPFEALDQMIRRGAAAVDENPDFFRLVAFLSMESSEDTAAIASTLQGIHDRAVSGWHDRLVHVFQPRTPAEEAATKDLAELGRTMYLGAAVLWETHGQVPFTRASRAFEELLQSRLPRRKGSRTAAK